MGTTIYPGLQVTSVALLKLAHSLGWEELTLTDVCVFVPALFGAVACMAVYALAVSFLGDAKSSLGYAKSSLGDAESSLGDAKSSLGYA